MALFSFHPALLPGRIRRELKQFMETPVLGKGKKKRRAGELTTLQLDVVSALRNQGYRVSDARAAVRGRSGGFDAVFRGALQSLRRK